MTSKLKTLSGTNFRYECAEGNYFPKGKNSALKGSIGVGASGGRAFEVYLPGIKVACHLGSPYAFSLFFFSGCI